MSKKNIKEAISSVFAPPTPKEKTTRMARNFCITQILFLAVCIYAAVLRYVTVCALCILAEYFEWRFFSLSIRLRRYDEEIEEKEKRKVKHA